LLCAGAANNVSALASAIQKYFDSELYRNLECKRRAIRDLVLIATNHKCVNYQEVADWAQCVVDTRNAMAAVQVCSWKALENIGSGLS